MSKPTRKIPQSVKVQRRIDEAVKSAISDKDKQLLSQAKRHQKRIEELQSQIEVLPAELMTTELIQEKVKFLVSNWRSGWKWLSNWMFALIAYVAVYGVPPEIMALIPISSQSKIIAALSVIGMASRFINQSKLKTLPEAQGDIDDYPA